MRNVTQPAQSPPCIIDRDREPAITLSQAARLPQLLINNKPLNPTTLWRWGKLGVIREHDGERVYLEMTRRGKVCVTSEPAVDRFIARLNGRDVPATEIVTTGAEAAERELASAGIA